MAVTLRKISSNTASVTFQASDDSEDTATIVYRPALITEKTYAQLRAFSNEQTIEEGFASLNALICQLVKSWDVYEDDEQTVMYPLDPDKLADLPIAFRLQIIDSIMGDIRPNTVAPQIQS